MSLYAKKAQAQIQIQSIDLDGVKIQADQEEHCFLVNGVPISVEAMKGLIEPENELAAPEEVVQLMKK